MPQRGRERSLQGFGERVVVSGQLVLLDRDCVRWHHEPIAKGICQRMHGQRVFCDCSVIWPKYGLGDRSEEGITGFGARLLGIFDNGVVQSFINARTLSPSDMKEPRIAAEIAKELHKFHQVDIPGSKEPQLWNDIFKFLKKASVLKFEDNEKQKRYETISFREIQDEVKELKDLSDLLHAPVVFSHNDLLSGNLMLNDLEEKLYFIDFEYGSYSYRGYDIANHFNEYAGFDCDYNLYPDKEVQYHFFRNYLLADRPSEVQVQDLEALYVETNTYRLASHIYWALWALIQANVSPIDFDYLGYFFLRYGEYKKQREFCFSLAQGFLSARRNG